jgi:GcrA cell cycle regulator
MTWTDEAIEQLRQLTADGLYASEIAANLKTTRNSVIGKQHRLGLISVHKPSVRKARMHRPVPRMRPPKPSRILVERPIPRSSTSPDRAWSCTIMELQPWTCRFPLEEIAPRQFLFCGAPAIDGCPYCGFHARVAYNPGGVDNATQR